MDKYYKFLVIKILSIAFYSLLFLISGFLFAVIINYFQPKLYETTEDEKNNIVKRSNFILTLEVIISLLFIVVAFYFIRKILKKVPYPFDGLYGFKHERLQEMRGVVFFAPVFFILQPRLVSKIIYLRDKLFETKYFFSYK